MFENDVYLLNFSSRVFGIIKFEKLFYSKFYCRQTELDFKINVGCQCRIKKPFARRPIGARILQWLSIQIEENHL